MKDKIFNIFRHSVPFFVVALLLFCVAAPVSAAELPAAIESGSYVFNKVIDEPDQAFSTILGFKSNGQQFSAIRFSFSEAGFSYPALYYVSEGNTVRVCVWMNGSCTWVNQNYRIMDVNPVYPPQKIPQSVYSWITLNSSYSFNYVDDLPSYDQNQDIQNALDNLEELDDYYNQLPDLYLSDINFGVGIFTTGTYDTFLSVLQEIWNSSLISSIMATVAAFILISYLIFAGKS